ncbi:ABC transporter permease [Streptococcus ruminantium]|uniref:ABC transporter permease n=1 Tax=Streptococcus ruminantium TaxID=1917441 RepID=A0ABU1B386_9STRE|nr:ABC transporter permease [Streptococcus ruminantium]MDQ8758549.1 ABC transporter permease [Streptococcus ruminantium]MDQ8765351.1 ABC transporter permease [Streptococcus ruminantium]MDQ8768091.1 ABC transporter permease [Streptococcus ruminantium]MDQ8794253.1 ABC transporter permease [Streptococcus ruminantium]MDQ8796446.1 ABC transporter permease [Streptococcus ruminantium]
MKVIISSALVHMKQAIARSMFRYCLFLNPLCNAVLLGLMYSNRSNQEFTLYAILGTSLSSFWTIICFSSAADINREKYLGTLPILFTSPSGFKKIIFGKLLGNSLWGVIAFLLNIFFVTILFNRFLVVKSFSLLVIVIVLAVLTFVSIGMLMCSAFTLSRSARLLMNLIEYPLLLVTGMVFSLDVIPQYVKWFSYILSPTWVMEGFELAVYGGNLKEIFIVISILSLLTVFNFIIAYFAFVSVEKKSRIDATLEVY